MIGFIRAEMFKTFRTKEYYYCLLLPLGFIIFVFYDWSTKTHNQYLSIASNFYFDKSPWHMYFAEFLLINTFFFPFLVVILIYFNVTNEHNKKTWKYHFTIPHSDIAVFVSKEITCWIWLFLALAINFLFAVLFGYVLSYFNKDIPFVAFNSQIDILLLIYLKLFFLLMPLVPIQLLLNMFFKGKLVLFIVLPLFSWISWIEFSPYNLTSIGLLKIIAFDGRKYSFGHNISFFTKFDLFALIFLVSANTLHYIFRYQIINKIV